MSSLKLISGATGDAVDPLALVLISCDKFQVLPELLEIFGRESLLKFIDIFAGQTIKVPDRDVFDTYLRDVSIWKNYCLQPYLPTLQRLADVYSISVDEAKAIVDRIDNLIHNLELVIQKIP